MRDCLEGRETDLSIEIISQLMRSKNFRSHLVSQVDGSSSP